MTKISIPFGLLAIFFLLTLVSLQIANSAPMPPRPVVNHQTRQCAIIVTGDECGDVILPDGWDYLDEAAGEQCPTGYATIDLYPEWMHFKVAHCCMEGHSGSSGDCQDVVINQSNRQCAFVEDIQTCTELPDGWNTWGKDCPAGFEWVDQVVCISSQTDQTLSPTLTPQIKPTLTASESDLTKGGGGKIGTPESTEPPGKTNHLLVCPSMAMIFTAIACIVIMQKR